MDSRFDIKFTELAKQEGVELAAEGYGIRFAVSRSGCCAINVSLYPDAKKEGDTVIDIEGVPLFVKDGSSAEKPDNSRTLITRNSYGTLLRPGAFRLQSQT